MHAAQGAYSCTRAPLHACMQAGHIFSGTAKEVWQLAATQGPSP